MSSLSQELWEKALAEIERKVAAESADQALQSQISAGFLSLGEPAYSTANQVMAQQQSANDMMDSVAQAISGILNNPQWRRLPTLLSPPGWPIWPSNDEEIITAKDLKEPDIVDLYDFIDEEKKRIGWKD